MNVLWLGLLIYLHFFSHWLQRHRCTVLAISAWNFFSLCFAFPLPLCPCATALTAAVSTCMTSVILLTVFSSSLTVRNLSLCLVSHAFMRSHLSRRRWGPDFWMFTQMCLISGAVLDEQNVITCCMYSSNYDFLFFLLHISISPCLCCGTLLYEKLLWMPFFPQAVPVFFFLFVIFLNGAAIAICQHQVEE